MLCSDNDDDEDRFFFFFLPTIGDEGSIIPEIPVDGKIKDSIVVVLVLSSLLLLNFCFVAIVLSYSTITAAVVTGRHSIGSMLSIRQHSPSS